MTHRMGLQTMARKLGQKYIGSVVRRTALGYTIDLADIGTGLSVITWGYDYEEIDYPKDRAQLVANRVRAQMSQNRNTADEIRLRFYLELQRMSDEY